jgi:hypothetical protein
MLTSTLLTLAAALVAEVKAHGAVTSYIIGGVTYPGYEIHPLLLFMFECVFVY